MASAIDDTKPVTGTPTTQSVRDNFAAAKSEITALQAAVPTWTVGSVPFAVSTTALGQDNASLFYDNANDRLGIGTTGPDHKLTVVANNINLRLDTPSANQSVAIRIYDGGNARWGISTTADTNHDLQFYSNSTGSAAVTMPWAGGLVVGAPTGGAIGNGKINANEIRANNVVLTSDAGLKTGVEPLTNCLALVATVEPKSFKWLPLEDEAAQPLDFTDKINRGFLAQDVFEVMGGDVSGVDLGGMVAVLWQAVRELQDEVNVLKGDKPPT